jgi:hypothetical protein
MLPIIRANAEHDLYSTLPFIIEGKLKKKYIDLVCHAYRIKGICSFFLDGSPQALHMNLQKSGAMFLKFLVVAKEANKTYSNKDRFFDSVACKDFDVARKIAVYSRHTWNQEEEYEDDFFYVSFLMKKFFLNAEDNEILTIVNNFEGILGGADCVRLDICKAFSYRDDELFDQALNLLIAEHRDYFQGAMDRDEILEKEWATEGQLFIEGLSLVRLAERLGMKVQKEYLFIPSLARINSEFSFGYDTWMHPDS